MSKFISPLSVFCSKAKRFILNLNQYRNTHFRLLNNSKINYKKYMERQILSSKFHSDKVLCIYRVYPKTKRGFDIGNVCSVHEKFFEDALVELGKLPDANYNYIPLVIFMKGDIDKENPRVEIEVVDFNEENVDKVLDKLKELL